MSSTSAAPTLEQIAQWRHNLEAEQSKALLYRCLSESETHPRLIAGLQKLSQLEARQADYWRELLPAAQRPRPDGLRLREQALLQLAKRFGVPSILPIIAADAARTAAAYGSQPAAGEMKLVEVEVATQAATLAGIVPAEQPAIDIGRDHRRQMATNGTLRAAVFGVNDGLVSNLSLVMGVAGAAPPNEFILLAGLAGLLAGAFSMAGGEFISMLSQREVLERQLDVERRHIELAPDEEQEILAERYQAKGLPPDQAQVVAAQLMADPERALDVIAREQLGLDPTELGSPHGAAISSFLAFAAGAVIAPAPFVFTTGWTAVILSAVLSAVALFLVGVGVSFFTGRHWLISGLRMLGVGAAAAVVTFVTGRVIGVSVAG